MNAAVVCHVTELQRCFQVSDGLKSGFCQSAPLTFDPKWSPEGVKCLILINGSSVNIYGADAFDASEIKLKNSVCGFIQSQLSRQQIQTETNLGAVRPQSVCWGWLSTTTTERFSSASVKWLNRGILCLFWWLAAWIWLKLFNINH